MHERRFQGDINRLRYPERLERLELNRVVNITTEGASYHRILDVGTGSGVLPAFYQNGYETVGSMLIKIYPSCRKVLLGSIYRRTGRSASFPR